MGAESPCEMSLGPTVMGPRGGELAVGSKPAELWEESSTLSSRYAGRILALPDDSSDAHLQTEERECGSLWSPDLRADSAIDRSVHSLKCLLCVRCRASPHEENEIKETGRCLDRPLSGGRWQTLYQIIHMSQFNCG